MLLNAMTQRPLTTQQVAALREIRNRIIHGVQAPSIRELQAHLGYRSPRSVAQILERLAELGFIRRRPDGKLQLLQDTPEASLGASTIAVPLVGSAPCGSPLLAEQNIEAMIPISKALARAPGKYFLLRALGDSMNLAGIKDGELVLVKQQSSAQNGERVVALIDDEATIKEIRFTKDAIALVPRSRNKSHKPIYLTTEFHIQGVVKATLPDWTKG